MNQSDFRRLLKETNGSVKEGQQYGGKRQLSEEDLQEIKKLCGKNLKKQKKKSIKESHLPSTTTITQVEQSKYRDRAAERRQGIVGDMINADEYAHLDVEQTKFLGGDMEHTHLVKGLDYALLARLKREKEKMMQVKVISLTNQNIKDEAKEEKLKFKSRMSRLIYFHSCQQAATNLEVQTTQSKPFLRGRTYYTFHLASTNYESIPIVIHRSEDDCPEGNDVVCGMVKDLIISQVHDAIANKKASRRKKIRKETDGIQQEESKSDKDVEETKASLSEGSKDNESDDEDIFPDVGEYIPIGLREKSYATSLETNASKGVGYFEDLSASITAADEAEKKEREANELALQSVLQKAVAKHAQFEKVKETQAKVAKFQCRDESYDECFPDYQNTTAMHDSDDEEYTTKDDLDNTNKCKKKKKNRKNNKQKEKA